MFGMASALALQPDAWQRSRWPVCHNPYVRGIKLLSASKAKETKARIERAFERAFSVKHDHDEDRTRLQEYARAEYASVANLHWIDGHGTIHRLFPKVTKRGLKR